MGLLNQKRCFYSSLHILREEIRLPPLEGGVICYLSGIVSTVEHLNQRVFAVIALDNIMPFPPAAAIG